VDQKEQIHWVRWDSLLYKKVQHSLQSIQSSGNCSLFFWEFLRSSCWSTIVFWYDYGLLLRTGVQLVISYTVIKTQIVFEVLLVFITGQLTIVSQLEREVYPWRIELFLGSRGQEFEWSYQRCVCLVHKDCGITSSGSFTLLLEVRLKSLFFCLPSTMLFIVTFPVTVINSHY